MTNHPNRSKFPFRVYINAGKPSAGFADADSAHSYARWLSDQRIYANTMVEVEAPDGIVGQYWQGKPLPEWHGRGDEHYPAGRRA